MSRDSDPRASDLVFALADRKNFKSMKEIAKALGMHASTLSNHLRAIDEGSPSEPFLVKLLRILDVDRAQFQSLLEGRVAPSTFSSTVSQLTETQASEFGQLYKSYLPEVLELLNTLLFNDKLTLVTCFPPREFFETELQAAVIRCLQRGAQFRYVFPHASLDTAIRPYLTEKTLAWQNLLPALKNFCEDLPPTRGTVSYAYTNDPILVSPLSKYILIQPHHSEADSLIFAEVRLDPPLAYWCKMAKADARNLERQTERLTFTVIHETKEEP